MKRSSQLFLIIISFFIMVIGLYYYAHQQQSTYLNYFTLHRDYIIANIQQNPLISAVVFIISYIILIIAMIPLTIPINILAGYFFGSILATLYIEVAFTIGSLLSVLIFRYAAVNYIKKHYSTSLEHMQAKFKKEGIYYLLSLQLFPIVPSSIINIIAALSGIKLMTFAGTIIVGILPATIIYTLAGQQLVHINNLNDIISWQVLKPLCLLAMLPIIPLFIKYFRKRNNKLKNT